MYEFIWWWLLFLLPLPWLVRRLLRPRTIQHGLALKVPFLEDFAQQPGLSTDHLALLIRLLAWMSWFFLIVSAARPVWVGDKVELPVSGRDLMLAVDLSGSMQEKDFRFENQVLDRLMATKLVAGEFIEQRQGDRIGLVLFGDQAYLQAPLTFDRVTVRTLLNEAAIGLAGERTAIGDAIGLSLKRLQENPQKNRVLVLMTDGANTAGTVSPAEAADIAASEGLKIYTVGIGSESQRARRLLGFSLMNPTAELDERLLRSIARKTGGRYFRARDTEEFKRIYSELDRLEPIEKSGGEWRPQEELFRWPLLLSLLLGMGAFLITIETQHQS